MELDDVLNDKPVVDKPVVEKPVEDAQILAEIPVFTEKTGKKAFKEKERVAQEAGKAKAESVKEEPKVEAKVEPKVEPKQDMTDKERAFLAQAIDERGKRQELERRLKALEDGKPKEEPKQFWDDPEAGLNALRQEIQGVAINTRLNTAEMIARSKHEDFEEKLQVFSEIIKQAPALWQQALASPDPAEFAFRMGKNHLELQQAGNLDTLKAKIEKEIRIKVEQEYKEKSEKDAKLRADLPDSLSDVHGTTQKRAVWSGPTTLDSILGKE